MLLGKFTDSCLPQMRESSIFIIRHLIFLHSLAHQMHLHIILNESKQLCYLIYQRLKVGMAERYFWAVPTGVRVVNKILILVGLHHDIHCGADHQQDHHDVQLSLLGCLLPLYLLLEIVDSVSIDEELFLFIRLFSHFA